MAMNAILGGGKQQGGSGGHGSNPLAMAGQLLGGGHGGGHGSSSGGAGGVGGKLVGSLVSSFVTPSNKPQQPQNYHGGQTSGHQPQHGGGLAGAVMGGVASMFGGKPNSQSVRRLGA